MKKIFLLSCCVYAFTFCDTPVTQENLTDDMVTKVQEDLLKEILQRNVDLKKWYDAGSQDKRDQLAQWSARLVSESISAIRKSDDVFMQLLEDFEELTQLTNVKLVTEIDVTLQPADADSADSKTLASFDVQQTEEQPSKITQDVLKELSAISVWYESANDSERKQLDYLLSELFSCINRITADMEEAQMRDLAGAIRILTGLNDLEFTLSVQMAIDQKSL